MCFLRGAFSRWKSSSSHLVFLPRLLRHHPGGSSGKKTINSLSMKIISSIILILFPIIQIGFSHLPQQSLDLFQFVPEMYHSQY